MQVTLGFFKNIPMTVYVGPAEEILKYNRGPGLHYAYPEGDAKRIFEAISYVLEKSLDMNQIPAGMKHGSLDGSLEELKHSIQFSEEERNNFWDVGINPLKLMFVMGSRTPVIWGQQFIALDMSVHPMFEQYKPTEKFRELFEHYSPGTLAQLVRAEDS